MRLSVIVPVAPRPPIGPELGFGEADPGESTESVKLLWRLVEELDAAELETATARNVSQLLDIPLSEACERLRAARSAIRSFLTLHR